MEAGSARATHARIPHLVYITAGPLLTTSPQNVAKIMEPPLLATNAATVPYRIQWQPGDDAMMRTYCLALPSFCFFTIWTFNGNHSPSPNNTWSTRLPGASQNGRPNGRRKPRIEPVSASGLGVTTPPSSCFTLRMQLAPQYNIVLPSAA